jgi:orotate phosphoribosyltransferase-like protein
MAKRETFNLAIEELAEYAERLKNEKGLSDREIRDILDIVRQNYV